MRLERIRKFKTAAWIVSSLITMMAYSIHDARSEVLISEEAFLSKFPSAVKDSREVPVDQFGDYQIVVDVFRASAVAPILGKFRYEYTDSLSPHEKGKSMDTRVAEAKTRYARIAGNSKTAGVEFAVVSVDGTPIRAYLISGASETLRTLKVKNGTVNLLDKDGREVTKDELKVTPPGNYLLTPVMVTPVNPLTPDERVPEAFKSSGAYDRSTMFWALQFDSDGRYMHKTPHYFELGKPASMGCVRQSGPDAMWLFDLVVNKSEGRKAMVRIHAMHSVEAQARLREIFYDPHFVMPSLQKADGTTEVLPYEPAFAEKDSTSMTWLVGEIYKSYSQIKTFIAKTGMLNNESVGHGWWNSKTHKIDQPEFPKCGTRDCFEAFYADPMAHIEELKQRDLQDLIKARRKDIKMGRPIPRADSILLKMPVAPLPDQNDSTINQ